MKATNTILATIALILSAHAAEYPPNGVYPPEHEKWAVKHVTGRWDYERKIWDTKADRAYIRKPYGSHIVNVKHDGFIIIGDYYAPLDWHERIIRHLKIIKKGAPDIYKMAQKHAWKIQYNGNAASQAAPWKNLVGVGLHEFNYGHGMVTAVLIHEFMHCHPKDGSHGPVWYAGYRYGKRCGVHPHILFLVKAHAMNYGWDEERWNRVFPNMK